MNWCVSRPDHESAPSMPSWFGARCSDRRVSTAPRRVLTKICERVRGCRADAVCQYEVIDLLAVQIALRASSANADFQLSPRDCGPLRSPTCALFDRDRLRASSILARDFSARTTEPGRAPCFSTICERSPLARREANRWSGGPSGSATYSVLIRRIGIPDAEAEAPGLSTLRS